MANNKINIFKKRRNRSRYRLGKCNASSRLRISCSKSNRYLFVQLVNDKDGCALFAKSTISSDFDDVFQGKFARKNREAAEHLGKFFANQLRLGGIKDNLVFDKGGYAYQGVIKSLSESMRSAGLVF